MSSRYLIVFLGRNTVREDGSGILSEAREAFPEHNTIVVASNGDRLLEDETIKKNLEKAQAYTIEVKNFKVEPDTTYIVIANGGMSKQLVPILMRLASKDANLQVHDLQRDGTARLWPEG